jgi:hypothetical protein
MTLKAVTIPELVLIAGTRVVLGIGIGLLIANRFKHRERRTLGWTLAGIGALSTIPIMANVLRPPPIE